MKKYLFVKKISSFLFILLLTISLCACKETTASEYNVNDKKSMLSAIEKVFQNGSNYVEEETKAFLDELRSSDDSYAGNKDNVKAFYSEIHEFSQTVYTEIEEISIDYFKSVAADGLEDYDDWNESLEKYYDSWNEGMSDFLNSMSDSFVSAK